MKFKLVHLQIICRQSIESVPFGDRVSFFHGEMSSGKSTIPALIDYCLGGKFPRTPALTSELISVQMQINVNGYDILLERSPQETTNISVSWRYEGDQFQLVCPLTYRQGLLPIFGENIYTFSDLMLMFLGLDVIRVKKRSYDDDSTLIRLGFRDILKFVYLDQDHLDSDLFLLEVPIRKEKSQDVLRFFVGYMSERLNELQHQLQELRQKQRTKREAVSQIKGFLSRFDFGSEEKINDELKALQSESEEIEGQLGRLNKGELPIQTVAEEDRTILRGIKTKIDELSEAISELEMRIREQETLQAELVSLKFKAARTSIAKNVLGGAEFEVCPVCGSDVAHHHVQGFCYLCKTPDGQKIEPSSLDIVRQDLDARIQDLKQSISRHGRAVAPLRNQREVLRHRGVEVDERISNQISSLESEYFARRRTYESRIAAINERSDLLTRIRQMPAEIERSLEAADDLGPEIEKVRRLIEDEEESLKSAEANINKIEDNYKLILRAIHFPGFTDNDVIVINRKTFVPEILQGGDERRSWTFFDAGSGGKKTLLKICYALAIHKTAAENNLPVPSLLIIDSPMKNITPDVNQDVFENFYREVYKLMVDPMSDWQLIFVDQTYVPPPPVVGESIQRKMFRDSEEFPPLISYYRGP